VKSKLRVEKKWFCIEGYVEGMGYIKEYVHAFSGAQALKFLGFRLGKRHSHLEIYLGNCSVSEVTRVKL